MATLDESRKLALEFAKALIQNNNIKPVFNHSRNHDLGDENIIAYALGDAKYSFVELVSHFLDNIEKIKKWD